MHSQQWPAPASGILKAGLRKLFSQARLHQHSAARIFTPPADLDLQNPSFPAPSTAILGQMITLLLLCFNLDLPRSLLSQPVLPTLLQFSTHLQQTCQCQFYTSHPLQFWPTGAPVSPVLGLPGDWATDNTDSHNESIKPNKWPWGLVKIKFTLFLIQARHNKAMAILEIVRLLQ